MLDSADLVDEEPAVEEDEVDDGYVLEEKDEKLEKKRKKTRVSGRLGAGTRSTRNLDGLEKAPCETERRLSLQAENIASNAPAFRRISIETDVQ